MTNDECVTASGEMWERFGRQLSDAIPDLVIGDQVHKAMQYALCADVCFWQSTGEADSFNFKEALACTAPQFGADGECVSDHGVLTQK